MAAVRRERRLRAILALLDPQKVKTSLVLMVGMLFVSGLVLMSAYLQARKQMEDTSRALVARRAAENAVLLDRSLRNFQQTLYSLAVDKDIFWLKNWNQYEDTKKLDLYYRGYTRCRSSGSDGKYWICTPAFRPQTSCLVTESIA